MAGSFSIIYWCSRLPPFRPSWLSFSSSVWSDLIRSCLFYIYDLMLTSWFTISLAWASCSATSICVYRISCFSFLISLDWLLSFICCACVSLLSMPWTCCLFIKLIVLGTLTPLFKFWISIGRGFGKIYYLGLGIRPTPGIFSLKSRLWLPLFFLYCSCFIVSVYSSWYSFILALACW